MQPQALLVAGARRSRWSSGQYAAACTVQFQTSSTDLRVRQSGWPIVGGGNVGLIAGYHALQAGIDVVGLVSPTRGGYKVHRDAAPHAYPSTPRTILSANGTEHVESVTVAQVDPQFRPIPGTEKSFACDTVLIAVGLDPVNEFYVKAQEFGLLAFAAGDAEEIAEASAAMFSGKIKGLEVARALGQDVGEIPPDWYRTAEILRSKPGAVVPREEPAEAAGVSPSSTARRRFLQPARRSARRRDLHRPR